MRRHRLAALSSLVLAATLPGSAYATNGYFSAGYDDQSTAEAGVGVSSATGVEAAAANPALGVKAGNSVGGGVSFFSPHRDDTNSSGHAPGYDIAAGTFTSAEELFYIPYLGANYQLDDRTAASFLLYANGGMNTHYKDSPFAGFGGIAHPSGPAGVDLEQVFITPNLARTLGYGVSVGGGPVVAIQRFKALGLQAFDNAYQSSAPGSVTNNGYDYSYGAGFKFGATWDATPWLTFGVAYQSRVWTTDFTKYKGLFADQGNFDVPPEITDGVTIRPLKTLDVSFEHEHIFYGDVSSIANAGNGGLLGTSGGKGFGWNDIDIFRIGTEWRPIDRLALRAGFSHATDFTTGANALFNILAPATVKDHLSVGAAYDITPNWNVALAYVHAFSNTLDGWSQVDPSQTIKLRMDQDEVTLGVKYHW